MVTGLSVKMWHRLNETHFQSVDQLQKKQLNVSLMMLRGPITECVLKHDWYSYDACNRERGRGRRIRDCECLMERLIILELGFLAIRWRKSWLQIFFHFVLKCASYSFDCFVYSVNSITAAQIGQRSNMHGESLAIVYLCNYNKKGTHGPSTVFINISEINWWSLDFHSSQGAATLIHLNRKLLLKEYFGPSSKGNMLAKGSMFQR